MAGVSIVGRSLPRVDALDKVTGRAQYCADISMPGLLHGGLVRSPIRHGLLRTLDVAEALRVPGVRAVLTAQDIPGKRLYGAPYEDHPVFAYDRLRFIGDPIALVVADTPEALTTALGLVHLEYDELPTVLSSEEAMQPQATILHPGGNLVARHRLEHGDVSVGFHQAAHIVVGEYHTDWQDHAFIELPAVLAYPEGEGVVVVAPSQNPFSVRGVVAQTLALAPEQVRIVQPEIGGSFGGKNDFIYHLSAQVALAAWRLQCPVRVIIPREESMLAGNKRHPMTIWHRTGLTADGRICAAEVRIVADGGAYASISPFVLWRAVTHACGAYEVPHARVTGEVYYTNNVPASAMRGFGSTQAIFAAERHMDRIAVALGMDPVELRRRNLLRPGSTMITGEQVSASIGLEAALDRALELSGWSEQREAPGTGWRRKGLGLALSLHGVSLGADEGRDFAGAILILAPDGRIVCQTGMTDLGTGVRTALAQIIAESIGVAVEAVEVRRVDTSLSPNSNKTVASRSTFMGGMAAHRAARELRDRLEEVAARCLQAERSQISLVDGCFRHAQRPGEPGLTLADLATWACGEGLTLESRVHHELPLLTWDSTTGQGQAFYTYGYGAQVAEVTVDEATGKVDVERLTVVVDCGRAINPSALVGQICGGAAMGAGYALLEDLGLEGGHIASCNLDTYLLMTAADIGEIRADWVEAPDEQGPYGAKGIAELTAIGVAPSIVNAIHAATGQPIDDIPATLERVFLGCRLRKPKNPVHGG